jgi:hypothetical protein
MAMMFYTYAHIRPDTGVIFYVGKGKKRRAYSKSARNDDWHDVVNKNCGKFEIKILNWFNSEEDAYNAEIWQISQLSALGNLVNRASGGNGVVGWSENMRRRHSEQKRKFLESTEGKVYLEKLSERVAEFYASDDGQRVKDNHSKFMEAFISSEEGKEKLKLRGENHSKWFDDFLESDEGANWVANQRLVMNEFHASEAGAIWRKEHSQRLIDFNYSEKGIISRRKRSEKIHEFLETDKGKLWVEENSLRATELWKSKEYRDKQMYHNWAKSNMYTRKYWGA